MDPVGKALWYIESHFEQEISLDEVASVAGVSRYHLSRAFGIATGHSITRYTRARRLTEAARRLADGAPDILAVAIDVGCGSHEAFTRAFRDQFGLTPEAVRLQGHLENIERMEAIKMEEVLIEIAPPRFADRKTFLIAGLSERYNAQTSSRIPAQWQRFGPYIGNIPGQVGSTAYGVICNGDDEGNTDYVSGVEVSSFSRVQPELTHLRVPDQRYAVFSSTDHISKIRSVWHTIFVSWLPQSGYEMTAGPEFELYGPSFDPRTGTGGFEIWVPVKASAG